MPDERRTAFQFGHSWANCRSKVGPGGEIGYQNPVALGKEVRKGLVNLSGHKPQPKKNKLAEKVDEEAYWLVCAIYQRTLIKLSSLEKVRQVQPNFISFNSKNKSLIFRFWANQRLKAGLPLHLLAPSDRPHLKNECKNMSSSCLFGWESNESNPNKLPPPPPHTLIYKVYVHLAAFCRRVNDVNKKSFWISWPTRGSVIALETGLPHCSNNVTKTVQIISQIN